MNLSQMKAKLIVQTNTLQSNDPHYTYLTDTLNEAGNGLIMLSVSMERQNINLFPELRNHRFTDLTVAEQGYISKPSSMLVMDSLTYTKVATNFNPSRDTEYPVTEESDGDNFALLDKTSTNANWPQTWFDAATTILINPTPTTAFVTTVVMRGIRQEVPLVLDTDTFQMKTYWHPVVVDYAEYLMKSRMGLDEAEKVLARVKDRIGSTIDPLGLANRKNRKVVRIAGAA